MNNKWILILLSTSMFLAADTLSAEWAKSGNKIPLVFMFLLGPFAYVFFAYVTKHVGLAVASILVNIAIMLGGVLIGTLYYDEPLSTKQVTGIVLAVIAVLLINNP